MNGMEVCPRQGMTEMAVCLMQGHVRGKVMPEMAVRMWLVYAQADSAVADRALRR